MSDENFDQLFNKAFDSAVRKSFISLPLPSPLAIKTSFDAMFRRYEKLKKPEV